MKKSNGRAELASKLTDLEEEWVLATVRQRLVQGDDPLTLIQECQEGMRQVGSRYEKGQYYIAGMIMAGEIFREVMEIVQPTLEGRVDGRGTGRVLLGTVRGDIHDIGKNMVSMLLGCYGFTVIDLGVDVPPESFADGLSQSQPDVIGLSGLLTTAFDTMRETVTLLRDRPRTAAVTVPIVIGGGRIDEQVRAYVGADYWVSDAMSGVRLCQRLVAERIPNNNPNRYPNA
jgi:methanogenic corrinoid protein MtbC1